MTATNPWTNLSKKLKIKKKIMTLDHQKKKKKPHCSCDEANVVLYNKITYYVVPMIYIGFHSIELFLIQLNLIQGYFTRPKGSSKKKLGPSRESCN